MAVLPDPERGDDHRSRLLAAGLRCLAGDGGGSSLLEPVARVLATQAVVDRAGLTRTNLYRSFPAREAGEQTHDRYVRDVIASVLKEEILFDPSILEDTGIELGIETPDEAYAATMDLAKAEFLAGAPTDPDGYGSGFRAAMALWALSGDDPSVRDGLQAVYQSGTERAARFYERVLQSWGCSLTDFSTPELAVVLTSLLDGMLIRSHFDPDAVDPDGDLFARAVAAFVASVLHRPGAGAAATRDRFQVILTTADRQQSDADRRSDDDLAADIVAAARTLIAQAIEASRDPRAVTVRDVASAANCSTATVERLWGGTSILLIDSFYSRVEGTLDESGSSYGSTLTLLADAATQVSGSEDDEVARFFRLLGRMLYETALFASRNLLLTAGSLAAIEFGSVDGSGAHLRNLRDRRLDYNSISSRFERVIDVGQALGILRDDDGFDAVELGNLLPVTVLHQAIRREDWSARRITEIVYKTLVRGLAAEPDQMPSASSTIRADLRELADTKQR